MHSEFEMSMMGELNFFLRLQIKQLKEGTFINQAKYIRDLLKRFNTEEAKTMKTPMSSSIKLDKDEKGKSVNSTMYRGMIGHSLVSWHSKKQNSVALSTAKAKYIAVGLCCAQILWMKQSLSDFNLNFEHVPIKCDNTSAINISKNLVQHFRTKASRWTSSSLVWFLSHLRASFPFFVLWMAPRQETSTSRAHGKRPAEPSQPEQMEAGRKMSQMGWLPVVMISEPIFPTLVQAFYSRVTYGLGGPVMSMVRGVEIRLSPKSICRILDIPSVGLLVYEAKAWPTMPGFELREVVQRLCGLADAQGMGKPSAHSLIVPSRVLHHMIYFILLPQGRHRDEVSYLEAFIVDSILTGRQIHVGVDLSREADFEAPTSYDTYDEGGGRDQRNGGWVRPLEDFEQRGPELDIPLPPQLEGIHVEAIFSEPMMTESSYTAGPSFSHHLPSFLTQSYHLRHLTLLIMRLGWMSQLRSTPLGLRFERIEKRMDQQQATFKHLQQSIDRIESRQASQHEEMMTYLRSVFPPPPPQP
ncbi:hypothetical protein CK203_034349 [Vitis vinifera]|uniref:Putative plant transposon protein domain-containing protein n=1 Tax=Vitis vinifera TaxID=29760 RepID=A0A438INP7_VITVI|nr:hypothetical protein CK203_034349 [Vitis vinifera]